jgi:crotonobetainyl-CoA:carnitine CoA-transferase CaiB-like acyl-CoA transferase
LDHRGYAGKARALEGIRVLDLTRILAGPMATQTLADLGAEVIKLERPGAGDDTRGWGPPFLKDRAGQDTRDSTYFLCCNRGKKSVTLDIARPEGQQIVRRLAQQCDVLAENFKVGDLARHGLGYAALSRLNPRLVYCSITGYGQSGPYSERAGYDPIAQAMGGMMAVTGERDGPPQRVGVAVVDVLAANCAVIAILAALRHRDATGQGQHIDMALLDVQISAMINIAQAYLSADVVAARNGNLHPSVVPSQSFDCQDGMIMLAAGNDGQFARLCEVLGRDDWARDPRYATNAARVRNRAVLTGLLQELLSQQPVAHWTERLSRAGVPCGPINDIAQVFRDPQVQHRGMRIEMQHAAAGALPLLASPLRLSETPVEYRLPPPLLGEHTDQVLGALLGMQAAEIEALRRARVL